MVRRAAALLVGCLLLARCSGPPITAPIPFTTLVEGYVIPIDPAIASPFADTQAVLLTASRAEQAALLADLPPELAGSLPTIKYQSQLLVTIIYSTHWTAYAPTIAHVSAKGTHLYVVTDFSLSTADHPATGPHASLAMIRIARPDGDVHALTIHLMDATSGTELPSRRYRVP